MTTPTEAPVIAGVHPQVLELAGGAALFRQGDPAVGIYWLERGRVRMQRITADGSVVTLHVARPGELFAEASLFSPVYHCDALAEAAGRVWRYPAAPLRRGLEDDPQALWAFAADLAGELQALRLRWELRQTRSASQRLLALLALRADRRGRVVSEGPLKELGAELGLTQEALYRAIATLERRGLLRREPGALILSTAAPRPRPAS